MFNKVYVEEHFPTQINPNFVVKIAFSTGSFILFLSFYFTWYIELNALAIFSLQCGKINAVFAHSNGALN